MLSLIPFTPRCSMTRAMLITCKACNCARKNMKVINLCTITLLLYSAEGKRLFDTGRTARIEGIKSVESSNEQVNWWGGGPHTGQTQLGIGGASSPHHSSSSILGERAALSLCRASESYSDGFSELQLVSRGQREAAEL